MCHRLFFRRISENTEFVKNNCNDLNNLFPFAFRKCILESGPQFFVRKYVYFRNFLKRFPLLLEMVLVMILW